MFCNTGMAVPGSVCRAFPAHTPYSLVFAGSSQKAWRFQVNQNRNYILRFLEAQPTVAYSLLFFPGRKWESMPFTVSAHWSGRSRKGIGKPDLHEWRSFQSYSGTLIITLCLSVSLYTSLTTPTRSTHMQNSLMMKEQFI